ncbi:MAG TPA: SRPBCC family protein [Pseudonocardiaceae bacterium]|jgi:ribosome-associated toxin RatA of RatAB toxin-antitoxin module
MRRVELNALVKGVAARAVYDAVVVFARYPDLAPHVQSVVVHQGRPEPIGRSSWELHFRSGLLRWTEQERFRVDELVIEFEQELGDFDEFVGRWSLHQAGADTEVRFEAEFDFGIPSLEGILDPIAARVIKETVAWAVVGLFDDVRLDDELELTPAPTAGGTAER